MAGCVFFDGQSGKKTEIKLSRFSARAEGIASPMQIEIDTAINGKDIKLAGTFGSAEQLLTNQPLPITIQANAGKAEISVTGRLESPDAMKGIDLAMNVRGANLADLAALADVPLHDIGPYELDVKLSETEKGFAFKDLLIKVAGSDVSGSGTIGLGGERPQLSASLRSELVTLQDLLPPAKATGEKQKDATQSAAQTGQGVKLFSADPLPLVPLNAADVRLDYSAKLIRHQKLDVKDVSFTLALDKGALAIKPLTARVADGTLQGDFLLNAAGEKPQLAVNLKGDSIALGPVLRDLQATDLVEGGELGLACNLRGSGESISRIMAGLEGRLLLTVNDARINNTMINLAGADLLTELLKGMNPFVKDDKQTLLDCAVMNLTFRNGQSYSKTGLAFETEKMNVSGGGTINLKDELLDFSVKPQPKKGIGISAGGLAGLVRLQGPLSNPKPKLDELGVAKQAVSIGLALSTGGMSMLGETLFNMATADSSPCKTALAEK